MGFPWITVLRWVLPTIPEIVSTVRNLKKDQTQTHAAHQNDLLGRIDQLEKALALHSQINQELSDQLQRLQKRLQIAIGVAIFGVIMSVVALGVAVFR